LLRSATANTFVKRSLLSLARANLLPEGVWRRLPITGPFYVQLPDGHSFIYSATPNDSIGRSLFWRGLKWEAESLLPFYNLAKRSHLTLDIGSNTGIFALLACAANPTSQVIAFEPVPRVYVRLVENIKLNGWENRCQLRSEAVSNMQGSTKFHVMFADVPTSASLHLQGFRGEEGDLIDVLVTTVDAVCVDDKHVDLVKIDVEGFEDKVLEGMQHVLATSGPTIVIECIPDGPFQAVEAILTKFGYRFYHLRKEGPVAVDKIVPDQHEVYRNFLCIVRDDVRL
jgi:FkbM family methyltransferase